MDSLLNFAVNKEFIISFQHFQVKLNSDSIKLTLIIYHGAIMDYKKLEIETPKEITEVGEALEGILSATSKALEDGFQVSTDIPAIIVSAIANLSTAISGVQKIPGEVVGDPVMSVMGALVPVSQGIKSLISKVK